MCQPPSSSTGSGPPHRCARRVVHHTHKPRWTKKHHKRTFFEHAQQPLLPSPLFRCSECRSSICEPRSFSLTMPRALSSATPSMSLPTKLQPPRLGSSARRIHPTQLGSRRHQERALSSNEKSQRLSKMITQFRTPHHRTLLFVAFYVSPPGSLVLGPVCVFLEKCYVCSSRGSPMVHLGWYTATSLSTVDPSRGTLPSLPGAFPGLPLVWALRIGHTRAPPGGSRWSWHPCPRRAHAPARRAGARGPGRLEGISGALRVLGVKRCEDGAIWE